MLRDDSHPIDARRQRVAFDEDVGHGAAALGGLLRALDDEEGLLVEVRSGTTVVCGDKPGGELAARGKPTSQGDPSIQHEPM